MSGRLERARESAKKAGRKVFNAMCDFVRLAGKPLAVLVVKPDRLSRNYHDMVEIDGLMQTHDLEVHYVRLNKVLSKHSNSTEQFMHEIEIVLAKKFIANLAEEARKGMGQKARQGIFPGKAPLGYLNNPSTRGIDVDPVRGPVVRRMFEMYAEGSYSEEDLCIFARELGLADREAGRGSVSRSTIGLDHYLDLIAHRPGALRGLLPLAQARAAGEWPKAYDVLWEALKARHGKAEGTRQMVSVLLLHREHGRDLVEVAAATAVERGCIEVEAVKHLIRHFDEPVVQVVPFDELGELSRYVVAVPDMADIDALLGMAS